MSGTAPAPIAFFDVDETLIAAKGMLAFWDFWTADPARTDPGTAGPAPAGPGRRPGATLPGAPDLRAAMAAGVPREELNRMYYRRFAGVPATALRSAARRWYEEYRRGAAAFVTASLDALARHRDLGHEVVLVSGSLRPLLEAVAEDFGAAAVCCTEQLAAGGVLTGEVDRPMIGQAKADAVAAPTLRPSTARSRRPVSRPPCAAAGSGCRRTPAPARRRPGCWATRCGPPAPS
ncbi:HAD family hydrolase [Kitasatospora sp. NPDC001574]